VLVTFWGSPRRRTAGVWLHQCGSVEEALAAHAAGADGLIVQGLEAAGHVRGTAPALELFERCRAALPDGYPLWLAGGIAEPADVRAGLDAGAEAAVLGTRFVLSAESGAHPEYKRRAVEGSETLLTELFGAGWPARTASFRTPRPSAGSGPTHADPAGYAGSIARPRRCWSARPRRCRPAWPRWRGRRSHS
jgi:nitronate monooxygenase